MAKESDQVRALVKRAARGDADAFEALMQQYQGRIYAVALGMMRNPHDAMDAAQEAMLKVYRTLPSYRAKAQFATWLHRVVVNTCLDMLRKQKVRAGVSMEQWRQAGGDVADDARIDDALEQWAQREALQRALSALPADARAILVLRDMQDLRYEQIAQVLDISVGTVKSRLFRARAALRQMYLEMEQTNAKARPRDDEGGDARV
nr:sigma-70 family RNA polymerase sigma factor [Maliibacterium massiliense]